MCKFSFKTDVNNNNKRAMDCDKVALVLFFVLMGFITIASRLFLDYRDIKDGSYQNRTRYVFPIMHKRDIQGQEYPCTKKEEESELQQSCNTRAMFRTFTGHCNNVKNPHLGRKSRPLRRLLPAVYDDNYSALKAIGNSGRLLNPRVISAVIHGPGNPGRDVSHVHTLTLMQWGQFLAHDLVKTPVTTDDRGLKLPCAECGQAGRGRNSSQVRDCEPIPIPSNDGFFPSRDKYGTRKCIPFTRSAQYKITSGPREQFNSLTSFLDASNVYGSDPCHAKKLRTFQKGHLKMERHPWSPKIFKPLMPRTTINQDCKSPSGECFFGGDERSSEQPGLAAMHLIFVREHNRLADKLRFLNPHWNDERLYQEARKVVGAMHQHITYQEFLPRVLGPKMIQLSGLDQPYKYNPDISPEIYNSFATAAFRFGHSLIRSHFDLKAGNETGRTQRAFLKDNFFNIDKISSPHYIDRLTNGILREPMAEFDMHLSEQLTNHLFETRGQPYSGMDLASLNIQRGRDHGLPGYLAYLRFCTDLYFPEKQEAANQVKSFSDLSAFLSLEAAAQLSRVYQSVEDIDLFTGGLAESPLEGGVVGMTFGCLIAHQFHHLKHGDRFWYESQEEPVGFQPAQLREIQQTSLLASVMCRNQDAPAPVQPRAFDLENDDQNNSLIPCDKHPHLDVSLWVEIHDPSSIDFFQKTSCDVNGNVIQAGKEKRIHACMICTCNSQDGGRHCREAVPEKTCQDLISAVGIHAVQADEHCRKLCPSMF